MSELFNRFTFSGANWDYTTALCLLIIWLAVVCCALSSIRSGKPEIAVRRLWIFVVVCFPIVGLFAYLPFSVRKRHSSTRSFTRFEARAAATRPK